MGISIIYGQILNKHNLLLPISIDPKKILEVVDGFIAYVAIEVFT